MTFRSDQLVWSVRVKVGLCRCSSNKKSGQKIVQSKQSIIVWMNCHVVYVSEKKHKYQGKNRSLFFRPTQKNMTLSNFQCTLLPPVRNYLVPSRGCNLQHLTCTPDLQNFWRKTGPHENTKKTTEKKFLIYLRFCISIFAIPIQTVRYFHQVKFEKSLKKEKSKPEKKSEKSQNNEEGTFCPIYTMDNEIMGQSSGLMDCLYNLCSKFVCTFRQL